MAISVKDKEEVFMESSMQSRKNDPMTLKAKDMCPSMPCPLKRGSNVTFEYTFTPRSDHDELYHLVYLNVTPGIRLNFFGLHNTPICPFIHPVNDPQAKGCPLKKGVEYLYHLNLYINPLVPKVGEHILHWSFRDRVLDEDSICVELSSKITD